MPTYKAPVDDVMFLLSDVFHIDRYNNLPGFADATPDLVEAVLAEAAKFARRCSRRSTASATRKAAAATTTAGDDAGRIQGRL